MERVPKRRRRRIEMTEFNLSESILSLRRYLPEDGKMIYWQGDNKKNRGIYVDLGAVMGHFRQFIKLLKEITMIDFMDEETFDVEAYHERIDNLAGKELIDNHTESDGACSSSGSDNHSPQKPSDLPEEGDERVNADFPTEDTNTKDSSDDVCECGHNKHNHTEIDTKKVVGCLVPFCSCKQFKPKDNECERLFVEGIKEGAKA